MHQQEWCHFRNFSKNLRSTNSELRRFKRFRKLSQMSQCSINRCMAFLAPGPITRCQCCTSIITTVHLVTKSLQDLAQEIASVRPQVQLNYQLSAWIRLTGRSPKEGWLRQMQQWCLEESSCRTSRSSNEMEVDPQWRKQRPNRHDQCLLRNHQLRLSLKSRTSPSQRTCSWIRSKKFSRCNKKKTSFIKISA